MEFNKCVALVDCNNFFVSCERLFDFNLRRRPVVVLSNNDGRIIARSDEAKALGFKMADAAFQMQELIKEHSVVVMSSNYALYYDMCDRVREVLKQFTPRLEEYSIDECFLDLSGIPAAELEDYGRQIKAKVEAWTGIPVCVGIAETKCLAKLANRLAKKSNKAGGVVNLFQSPFKDKALEATDVGDLWGVGNSYEGMLKSNGIENALQFRNAPEHWVRHQMTVVGARIQSELKGISCLLVDDVPPPPKEVGTAQGFGISIESLEELEEAGTYRADEVAKKLRKHKHCVKEMRVYVQTDFFRQEPQHGDWGDVSFPVATADPSTLATKVKEVLRLIYKKGYRYKRVGIRCMKLEAENCVQENLFEKGEDAKKRGLLRIIDQLNAVTGAATVRLASVVLDARWMTRFSRQSPHYTTKDRDLPVARVG